MTTTKHDLFTTVHKALRRMLFEAAALLGRTDFTAPGELATARAAVTRCLDFLREHAEHEDRHLGPEILRLAPGLAGTLDGEHTRLEHGAISIDSLWPRVEALPAGERAPLAAELGRRLNALIVEHLRHMDREEREVNEVLWAHRTEEELRALHMRLVGSIPAGRRLEWFEMMLPALSPAERAPLEAARAQLVAA
jgi:hypothetical protein